MEGQAGHTLVSDDLVHWQPLTTQLGPAGWDGSLSIVEGTPTILFDCQSAAHCVGSSTHTSDLPVIGVGRPANITDPLLLDWIKDANNPIQVLNRRPRYAGPSNLWRGGPQKRWRMVMITGSATGLYESKDDSLHEWTLLNATFYPARGGGGGLSIAFRFTPRSTLAASLPTPPTQPPSPTPRTRPPRALRPPSDQRPSKVGCRWQAVVCARHPRRNIHTF